MARRRNLFCYLMVAPALLFALVLGVYPMLATLRMSVLQYDLLLVPTQGTPFVGLANFAAVLEDRNFRQAFVNTLLFVVIVVATVVGIALLLAQVLNTRFRGRGFVRTLALVPWFIPPVVAASIWLWLLNTERSPFTQILKAIGLVYSNIRYLTNPETIGWVSLPMLSVSAVRVWGGLSFVTVVILAGLQSIPEDIYEAADIDGANSWQKYVFITLPLLKPVLAILVTLLAIGGVGHFEVNYVMTGGGPQGLTNVLAVLSYQQAFTQFRFDLAAAISAIILVITGVMATFYIRNQIRER